MERTARCQCGQLSVTTMGEPLQVAMCHCEDCQRRTGSSFNLAAWFPRSRLRPDGAEKTWARVGDSGLEITNHFCPECGTSVYWDWVIKGETYCAVAVGGYADPSHPGPTLSLYGKRRHGWVSVPHGVPAYVEGYGSEREDGGS